MEYFFIFVIVCALLFAAAGASFVLYARYLTKACGWDVLALYYRATEKPNGQILKRQSLMVGTRQFNKTVSFGATEEGLYLRSWFTRRALLIPWYEIGRTKETTMGGMKAYSMHIGDPSAGTLTVPMQLHVLIQSFTDRKRYY